jgi:hypothetical protein
MTEQKYQTMFIEPWRDGFTYIVERTCKGSRKLSCSRMVTVVTPEMNLAQCGDILVGLRTVPLPIRRAARQHLGVTAS